MCAETEPKTFRSPCLPQPYNLPVYNKLRSLNPFLSLHSQLEKIKEKRALLFSIMDQSYPSSRACCPSLHLWTKVSPKSLFVKISQFLLWGGGGHLSNKASFISARRLGSFPEEKGGFSLHSRVKTIISQGREEREQGKRKESQVRIIILIVVACQMGALKAMILYLIVHQAWKITADDEEWKSATATYVKDTNGSIVVEGACGYGDLHKATYGKYSAGLSSMLFNRGSACGACFEVRCVDHILWCLQGSPSVILTATDFCPPNYGLSADYGGWCNFPKEHFEMSEAAFTEIAEKKADIVPVQHRRVKCGRRGGLRFTVSGNFHFYQVLISNVGLDGEVIAVKVKGSKTAWIPMARNWGQNWQSNANLIGQPLSFEVTTSSRKTLTSYNVAPANWQFGQTFEGKQF